MFEEIKKERTTIIDNLKNMKKLNIHSREGHLGLLSAKNDILAHIKNEDENFYPVLKKKAASNNRLKETLNAFDKDMAVISKYTLDFFESIFTEEGIDLELALEKFIEVHTTRIKREEAILYSKCGNAASI
ncbi:MAG: hypothetical protein R2568_06830 [Candidatus Scalindua sp.]|jgi:hypothetical protein|nr:hypothetical protein [Candidatus Scalindua sp.]MDV5166448.1 hypothetical protein [Candidatus Scalindua sp.]